MSKGGAVQIVEAYAQCLLDLAGQSEIIDPVEEDLESVAALLAREPSFQAFLSSPYFAEQTKRDLVRKILAGKLNALTLNFLSVLIDHDRGRLLPDIIDRYKQFHRVHHGYRAVTAIVSRPLPEDQRARMAEELAGAMQTKVDLDVRVDPSILGGVIFRYGDKMLDNSIRGRLVRTVNQIVNSENRYKAVTEEG
jgi:F-type H+-transporting ATPase subunit delta